jgi:hypothetical protein
MRIEYRRPDPDSAIRAFDRLRELQECRPGTGFLAKTTVQADEEADYHNKSGHFQIRKFQGKTGRATTFLTAPRQTKSDGLLIRAQATQQRLLRLL